MKTQLITIGLLALLFSCQSKTEKIEFEKQVSTVQELKDHSHEFDTPEVITVTDGVHVAVGFGLANSILIEGENGNIIVDCNESNEVAQRIKTEFDKISDKPVKAIIYTHNHADHIFGSAAMAGDDNPDVYAHELTNYYIDRLLNIVRPIVGLRAYRMFGTQLGDHRINCGIGPFLDAHENTTRSLLRPNKTFEKELETEIEGVKIKLVHAPGETDDQLFVWLPEKKALLPGDNIYKTFPNLYTIRGTPYRDVKEWAKSIDKMRYLEPEFLVPSHTQPIIGADTIQSILTTYRDGIQYVHDQTIRYMNKGFTPDEIAEVVKLPPHLSNSPYLKEFYGRVDWSAKNVFSGYLGFFDGNPSTLLPLPLKEKAEKMAKLAGGTDKLLEAAKQALEEKEFQWALELTDQLKRLMPDSKEVMDIRHASLIGLGEKQSNPNARNYYLSQALEIKGQSMNDLAPVSLEMVHNIPLQAIFSSLSIKIVPEKALNYNKKAVFKFPDVDEIWSVHARNGVAEIQKFEMEGADLIVETNSNIWKELSAGLRKPLVAIAKGDIKVDGGLSDFSEFMSMFREE